MFLEDFDRIVDNLKKSLILRESYLDSLPSNFSELIVDNPHTNQMSITNDMLVEELFSDMTDHVMWYLYEWKPGYSIEENGVTYIINFHKDFVEATKQIYRLPMKS